MSQEIVKVEEIVRRALSEEKVVIGVKSVVSNLQKDGLEYVIYAKNSPKELLDDVKYYSKFAKVNLVEFDGFGDKLSVLVKKPFLISFIGVLK